MKLKRTTKMGTYTVIISLVVLAAIIVVNMIASALPSKYTIYDTSAERLYSISEETEKSLRNISDDVVIYYLCQGGVEDDAFRTFLNRYTSANSKIKIKVIDPLESPAFVLKYTDGELSNYSLIVESAKRFKIINYLDIYVLDYMSYYYYGTESYTFNGERLVTSAIDYVTTNNMPTVYTITGHGEKTLDQTLGTQVTDLNYTVKDLSLLTVETVPEDASAIIMHLPSSDINDDELKKLKEYVNGGGKVFLITSAFRKIPEKIASFAEYCGMASDYGLIIEGDTNKCLANTPYGLLPTIEEHTLTKNLMNSAFPLIPYAHSIKKVDTDVANYTYTALFTTSDKAYTIDPNNESGSLEKNDDSLTGKFAVGAISENEAGGGLLWVGSDYVFTSSMNEYSSGANFKYFLSAVQYISPRDTIITDIPSVTITEPMLTVDEGQASFWSTMLTLVIPMVFIVIGLIKWTVRRRK